MPPAGVLWVTDFATAEQILLHKGFREVTFKGLVPLLGHVIVTLEGAAHRERRTLAGRLFWPGLLASQETTSTRTLLETGLADYKDQADLVEISYTLLTRLAARLIGLDNLESRERVERLVGLLGALVSGTHSHHSLPTPLTRQQARDELRQTYIDGAISKRRNLLALYQAGKLSPKELPTDLITLLLLHHGPAGRAAFDTRQIAGEVAFFAVAAIDTQASLVPHLFHELWQFCQNYPEYQPRLADSLFVQAAAAEALRLHPAIPTIFRQATEPVTLGSLRFESGQSAGLYVTEANRDPAVFGPDAASFNPLRSVPPRVRRAGLSFGGGLHLCLGRELAIGRPETTLPDEQTILLGQVTLLVQALLARGVYPDPTQPPPALSPFARDVYTTYPIIFPH